MESKVKQVNNLWVNYENVLSHLHQLERQNIELGTKAHNDSLRINYFNLEEKAKLSEYSSCVEKLKDLNEFFISLTEKLDQVEEILNSKEISMSQMEELNTFFKNSSEIKPRIQMISKPKTAYFPPS